MMEDGTDVAYPGAECSDETVFTCGADGCATVSLVFDYTKTVGETEMKGSVDAKTAMCNIGAANVDSLCSTMQNSVESSMGAVKNFKCNMATCNTDKCNDPSAAGDSSSLAVHISTVLMLAVFGYLF